MVATQLAGYYDKKDKNGVKVRDWAEQTAPSKAICKVCVPNRKIVFKRGCSELFKHSESAVHVESMNANKKSQPERIDVFMGNKAEESIKFKSKDLEIAIVAFLSRHYVPPSEAECLMKILKKFAPDSEIIKNVALGREKARYLTIHGVGDAYEHETLQKMKNSDAFSVQIDESEVNKVSQLEVMAKIATPEAGIETRHYRCLDLEAGDAETITDTLLDAFSDDQIDYKSKLIDVGMDGCATMQGHKTGVITRLVENVPQLVSTGSCNSHNCSNTMQHSTEAFDADMKSALVDIHQDLGGAKGRGLKKKKEFEAVCKSIGLEPEPIKRFVSTRFRTLRYCIKPVLHNYLGIVKYYKSVRKPTPRQKRLISYFVDRLDLTRIRLKFIFSATRDLNDAIDFFEEKSAHIHNTSDKLEQILCTQYRKVLDESELSILNDDTDELVKKPKKELVNIDLDKAKKLKDKELFVGQEVEKEIKCLGLSPSSPQLSWLFEAARKFHMTACSYLQKYFKLGLSSIVMDNMTALAPSLQSHILTGNKLVSLSVKYSKIVDNIQPVGGMDMLKDEIKRYVTDDDVKDMNKDDFEDYWENVSKLTEGAADWQRYEILPRFAMALGTKHDATGDVERGFSTMNVIHQNKQRNLMEQDTLNAHMHIKAGVEGKDVTMKCNKCKVLPISPHCHCELFEVSDLMREKCKVAHEKCKNAQKAAANARKEASTEAVERKEKYVQEEKKRIEKVKEDLKVKKVFCSLKLFEPIYKKSVKQTKAVDKQTSKPQDVGAKPSGVGSKPIPIVQSKSPVVGTKPAPFVRSKPPPGVRSKPPVVGTKHAPFVRSKPPPGVSSKTSAFNFKPSSSSSKPRSTSANPGSSGSKDDNGNKKKNVTSKKRKVSGDLIDS